MNSTYAKLVSCDQAIARHMSNSPDLNRGAAYRKWYGTLSELSRVRNRVIRNAGLHEYGPNHPRRDVARWQMTEQEWTGMETPGLGT